MSTELVFKRSGRVEIKVSKSAGGFVYVTVWQITAKRVLHLATINGASPQQCRLIDQGDDWVLEAVETRFHLKPCEGRKVHEQFGFQISRLSMAS